MKKIIETSVLVKDANEILHNCMMLGFSDDESAEDDLSYYLPRIKSSAENILYIVKASKTAQHDAEVDHEQ